MKTRDPDPTTARFVEVMPLLPADVEHLRLGHHSHLRDDDVIALIVQRPGASCWVPATGEFALVTPWRHRSDLVTIHSLSAFANERVLLAEVRRRAGDAGLDAVIMVDLEETRPASFYAANHFRRVEEIVTYRHERPRLLATGAAASRLRFVQVERDDISLLHAVHELDNVAFPWLWWNSADEFAAYIRFPGVEIWAGFLDDRLVAYAGMTNYRQWSHLDRIATHPDHQGKGLGRELLHFAVRQMVRERARSVSLSTQADNARSRTLYEGMGFKRTPNDDYAIYAAVLNDRRFPEFERRESPRQQAARTMTDPPPTEVPET